jgi:hypothetical protein
MENLTPEQIVQSISAAFDSVNLINEINAQTERTQDDINTIERNVQHLRIMMTKDWFVKALNKNQKTEINSIIS